MSTSKVYKSQNAFFMVLHCFILFFYVCAELCARQRALLKNKNKLKKECRISNDKFHTKKLNKKVLLLTFWKKNQNHDRNRVLSVPLEISGKGLFPKTEL
jgi:hypothetical protein